MVKEQPDIKLPKTISARQKEITADFLSEVDKHLRDIVEGKATEMYEIRDIARILHIHPRHLSNTIKLTTGNSPCYYFEEKILSLAKSMLQENKMSVADIATSLTYDPSNFTKFFKRFTSITPKQYREQFLEKTEPLTI